MKATYRHPIDGLTALRKRLLQFGLTITLICPFAVTASSSFEFSQINTSGFGDPRTGYSWSAVEWNGDIYIGTNKNFSCLEAATIQAFAPEANIYPAIVDPSVPCPEDPLDLDLRAEIWKFDPDSKVWERVFQSTNSIPIPQTDKLIAPDLGFRDMIVYNESDGTQALYAAAVSPRVHNPGVDLPAPRILRSEDGINFTPVPLIDFADILPLGESDRHVGFRDIESFDGRFFVVASSGLRGDGWLVESDDPKNGVFKLVKLPEDSMRVYQMAVFNQQLYIGVASENGYAVLRTNAKSTDASGNYVFVPIVTDGAGRGAQILSVVSMHPFKEKLYVGANGWTPPLAAEMIRIDKDDTWELVAGRPRDTPQGFKDPISGFRDGMSNPCTVHFWKMEDHNGILYVVTNDFCWRLRDLNWLDWLLAGQYGFDMYSSRDGKSWSVVRRDGFGNIFNFGGRVLVSFKDGLLVGTANHVTGTEVWVVSENPDSCEWWMIWCQPVAPVANVQIETTSGIPTLAWSGPSSATRFRVFRAEQYSNENISIKEFPAHAEFSGGYVDIGTTTDPFFQDFSAVEGAKYSYSVQAESNNLRPSERSNIVFSPPVNPPATLEQLETLFATLAAEGKLNNRWRISYLLAQIRAALRTNNLTRAEQNAASLQRLLERKNSPVTDAAAAEDSLMKVTAFRQRFRLIKEGIISMADIAELAKDD